MYTPCMYRYMPIEARRWYHIFWIWHYQHDMFDMYNGI